ncbi:transposase [Streptomyces sp. NPDC059680]|uniref:transposase n=1 Tax=Streptomyces sp. NPDC059680 TaxID=3346904 RepID=UPI0036B4A054
MPRHRPSTRGPAYRDEGPTRRADTGRHPLALCPTVALANGPHHDVVLLHPRRNAATRAHHCARQAGPEPHEPLHALVFFPLVPWSPDPIRSEGGKRRSYDAGFREGAVRIVLETGKSVAEVARDLGVQEGTLQTWVSRARRVAEAGTGPQSNEPPGPQQRASSGATPLFFRRVLPGPPVGRRGERCSR